MLIVDGHEDIAWNILQYQRDYIQSAMTIRKTEEGTAVPDYNGLCMLGKPEWIQGRIAVIFATLFAAPKRHYTGPDPRFAYSTVEEANRLYRRNLEIYQALVENHPQTFQLIFDQTDLMMTLETWRDEEKEPVIGLVLLMEGAEGIRKPEDVPQWYEAGLRILGPSWVSTQYSGGTREPGPLSADGRELLHTMQNLNMGLDLSHLSVQAAREALNIYEGIIIASHSNAKALLPGSHEPDRHLTDDMIRGIVEHGGVVGVVPFNEYLDGDWRMGDDRSEVELEAIVTQIKYICDIAGDSRHVGVGTDFDGGFGSESVPPGIETIADIRKIGEALLSNRFTDQDVEAILGGNWLRVLDEILPPRGHLADA